jgi:hypothetical protein
MPLKTGSYVSIELESLLLMFGLVICAIQVKG